MDEADSEPMALVWIESLDGARVPFERYAELYRRSIELRARRLAQGLKCEDFSVDMMIACWRELCKEIDKNMRDSGRYLPETAESDCPRCYGSGMEVVPGKGARPCKHEPLDPVAENAPSNEGRNNAMPLPEDVESVLVETFEEAKVRIERGKRERPRPKTAIGWINQARLDGGDQDALDQVANHIRAANRQDEIDNEKSEQ